MQDFIQDILANPTESLFIVGNLIIIESLLSVDNAAVLATMVMDLPEKKRKKALLYGILGAYILRGICLVFAAYLIDIWWLKPLGGIYLLSLVMNWKLGKKTPQKEDDLLHKKSNPFYLRVKRFIGPFWGTIIVVEFMDLAFSIENVIAAVTYSKNLVLIWTGVFIGILSMRLVAQFFVRLMERFPFLEICAFTVLGILGIRLLFSIYEHFQPDSAITHFMKSHTAGWIFSGLTLCIFFVPVITSLLFNIPSRKK